MNLEIETFGRTSIVRIREKELDYPQLHTLFNGVSALIDSGTRELVINLDWITYLDSASLGCLMDIFHLMSEHGGTVKLVGLQERVRSLTTMVGLNRHMEVIGKEETHSVGV